MENQIQAFIRKTNKMTLVSLVSGIIAITPYLTLVLGYLLAILGTLGSDLFKEITGLMSAAIIVWLFLPSLIFGLLFGSISLITSTIAIMQLRKKKEAKADYRLVIISFLLGVLGIIANIMFWHYLLLGLLRA